MDNEVKVQVVCVTYNQKDYIKEALDSFLMQKTNFKFEVLLGDDCSTDGTSEIVAEYAKKYPEIIKHIHREKNMGCLANFMDLCESVTAKYAAFCDGDDYWTVDNKLQKQYDFMEKNEDVNVCAHKVYVDVKEECATYLYYKNLKEAFVLPSKQKYLSKITVNEIIKDVPQTSSFFIRWQYIRYPNWAKQGGKAGDIPVCILNLGISNAYIFDEIMSVYRKTDIGVDYNVGSIEEHFLTTRLEAFRIYSGLKIYFEEKYDSFGVKEIESRLWREIINYVNAIVKTDRWDLLLELKEQYPDVYQKCKNLLYEYHGRLNFINILGVKRANMLREKRVLKLIKPYLGVIKRLDKFYKRICSLSQFSKNIRSFLGYWIFALVPKKKNLWVFSGFMKKNYMDNTKYLYEYIVQNHPEIKVVWLTKSKEIIKDLKEKGMPVLKMYSFIGIWTMARASIAFSDHFKMSDYENRYGFNARTKFVNLWHGVGLKDMRPRNGKLPNTTIPGVKLSNDIIRGENENFIVQLFKVVKYLFIAPFRELFEKYYLMICPGQQFIEYSAIPWGIPNSSLFLCGYSRHINLYLNQSSNSLKRILYAPTYRWKQTDEENLIFNFIKNIDLINQFLIKNDCSFTLRLHPHTWRNYESLLLNGIKNYPRFSISKEKDIYSELHLYSMMITDYSSIAYDYLLTERPLVFLAFDYDYCDKDYNFQMPYRDNCAGDIVYNWEDAITSMEKSLDDVTYNQELREKISNIFLPKEFNNKDNSKRIVEELKRRLKLK